MPPIFDAQAFEKDVAQILTALDAAQQQALTTQTQELAARIDALSTKVSDQQLHIDALQKQLDDQNDLIAKLDGVICRLEADIPELKKSLQRASALPIAMPPTADVEAAIAAFQRSPGYQELERFWAGKTDDNKRAPRTAVEKVFTHLKACTTTASPAAIQFALTFFCIRATDIIKRQSETFQSRMPELLNAPVTATDDAGKFAIDPSSKKKRFRLASFWAVDDAKTVFKDPSAPFISFFSTEKAALKTLIDALEKSEVTHGSREFNYVLWKTYLEPAFSAVATRPSKEGDA